MHFLGVFGSQSRWPKNFAFLRPTNVRWIPPVNGIIFNSNKSTKCNVPFAKPLPQMTRALALRPQVLKMPQTYKHTSWPWFIHKSHYMNFSGKNLKIRWTQGFADQNRSNLDQIFSFLIRDQFERTSQQWILLAIFLTSQ